MGARLEAYSDEFSRPGDRAPADGAETQLAKSRHSDASANLGILDQLTSEEAGWDHHCEQYSDPDEKPLTRSRFKAGDREMETLTQMKCVACRDHAPTVTDAEIADFHRHVAAGTRRWARDGRILSRRR
jgi:hypothetical protein